MTHLPEPPEAVVPSDVVFLGFAENERTTAGRENPVFWSQHLLGLRSSLLPIVYPFSLEGLRVVIAVRDMHEFAPADLIFRRLDDESSDVVVPLEVRSVAEASAADFERASDPVPLRVENLSDETHSWTVRALGGIRNLIDEPGYYRVLLRRHDLEACVGSFLMGLARFEPISPERRRAIESDPRAAKSIKCEIRCENCGDRLGVYAALTRDRELEEEGWIWHMEVGDRFVCFCERTKTDLQIIRENLPGFLGRTEAMGGQVTLESLYEKGALRETASDLIKVLDQNPLEEEIQKFLERNLVCLQSFSPTNIWIKPRVLGEFVADFAVLNGKSELVLVEIERAGDLVMTQRGSLSAKCNHAIGQVNDWLHCAEDHRGAVLRGFGLDRNEVSRISGVVVIGRDRGIPARFLRKFRWMDHGSSITVYTYDDLIRSLDSLERALKSL